VNDLKKIGGDDRRPALDLQMLKGCRIYLDFALEVLIIDPIVMGEKGVIAVEAKTRSKHITADRRQEASVAYAGRARPMECDPANISPWRGIERSARFRFYGIVFLSDRAPLSGILGRAARHREAPQTMMPIPLAIPIKPINRIGRYQNSSD
jgi:hypothetical protein